MWVDGCSCAMRPRVEVMDRSLDASGGWNRAPARICGRGGAQGRVPRPRARTRVSARDSESRSMKPLGASFGGRQTKFKTKRSKAFKRVGPEGDNPPPGVFFSPCFSPCFSPWLRGRQSSSKLKGCKRRPNAETRLAVFVIAPAHSLRPVCVHQSLLSSPCLSAKSVNGILPWQNLPPQEHPCNIHGPSTSFSLSILPSTAPETWCLYLPHAPGKGVLAASLQNQTLIGAGSCSTAGPSMMTQPLASNNCNMA